MRRATMHEHLRAIGPSGVAIAAAMGWDKLIIALAAVGAVVALTLSHNLDSSAAIGIISAVLGYVFGAAGTQAGVDAGVAAANSSPTSTDEPKKAG